MIRDLSGQVFGRLVAIKRVPNSKRRDATWLVACECGAEKTVLGFNLTNGSVVSCGCFHSEKLSEKNTTHGWTGTSEYNAWRSMWSRCTDENNPAYVDYQHRKPPLHWTTFKNFIADMGPKPNPELTLERIDNDKPYGPDNCEWATRSQQNKNRKPFTRSVK